MIGVRCQKEADTCGLKNLTAVRAKFEKAWGVPLNPAPGLKATEVFPAAIEVRK